MNLIHENKANLKIRHYVRKATRRWWFDLPKSKVEERIRKAGADFCVVLYGVVENQNDFYANPYRYLRDLLVPEYLMEPSDTHGPRWMGGIEMHLLTIYKCTNKRDVKALYGNIGLLL